MGLIEFFCNLLQTLILPCACFLSILKEKVTHLQVSFLEPGLLFHPQKRIRTLVRIAQMIVESYSMISPTVAFPCIIFSAGSTLLHYYRRRGCVVSLRDVLSCVEDHPELDQLRTPESLQALAIFRRILVSADNLHRQNFHELSGHSIA